MVNLTIELTCLLACLLAQVMLVEVLSTNLCLLVPSSGVKSRRPGYQLELF